MAEPLHESPSLALVREGWNHLKRGRPIAARASWLRALRLEPEQPAALEAIALLEGSIDLPHEARTEHRLRSPSTESQRKRWDLAFQGSDLSELTRAAEAFGRLVETESKDVDAWYNFALVLAWQGRNRDAIEALEHSVRLDAVAEPSRAIASWTLAELLRQGAGAEEIADDLTYTLRLSGEAASAPELVWWLERRPELVVATLPGLPEAAKVLAFLDRPVDEDRVRVPRVNAYLVRTPGLLKLSSPDPVGLEPIREQIEAHAGVPVSREASPLPLAMLDAAVWSIWISPRIDPQQQPLVRRSAVEQFYEDLWITRPRQGLDGRTPAEAARVAVQDAVLRAKLTAVVNFREQLGERPSALDLYQGYPFDRLRRRLGLVQRDPEAGGIDPGDPTCMSEADLDALDPAAMGDHALAEACMAALAFRNDDRTHRFGQVLIDRGAAVLGFVDRRELFAALVRHALRSEGTSKALSLLERAIELDRQLRGQDLRTFQIWMAEVFVRGRDPDEAVLVYERLLAESPDDAELALDAAETLLDQDFPEHARDLAEAALDRASRVGDARTARLARRMLGEDDA